MSRQLSTVGFAGSRRGVYKIVAAYKDFEV
jgi:hypothetical protein